MINVEDEVICSKEYGAFVKLSSDKEGREFFNKTDEELGDVISHNAIHTKDVTDQMKANSAYRQALATKKDFEDAVKDKLKPTKAGTSLATLILQLRQNSKKERS